jgi:hypothetical protein
MGKVRSSLDAALDRTRRDLSRRLMRALREGRLREEFKAIEREGGAFEAEAMNGHANGRSKRTRKAGR